jgi:copper transport protein
VGVAVSAAGAVLPQGEQVVGVLYGVLRAAEFAAFALLVGSVAFVICCWPGGAGTRWVRRVWSASIEAVAATTIVALLVQSASRSGRGLAADAVPPAITLLGRLALLLVAGAGLRMIARQPAQVRWRWAGTGLAFALALTWSTSGHAVKGVQALLAVPLAAAHLMAVAIWTGGLVLVAVLCQGSRAVSAAETVEAVRRFSPLALGCALATVVTGIYAAVIQVGSLDGLATTSYGRLLLAKLSLVAAVMAAAVLSRRWTARLRDDRPEHLARTASRKHRGQTGSVVAPSRRNERRAAAVLSPVAPGLRRSVLAQLGAAGLIFAVTAALVQTEPARTALAAAQALAPAAAPAPPPARAPLPLPTGAGFISEPMPFGSGVNAGSLQAAVEPGRVGANSLILLLTDPGGRAVDVTGARAKLIPPGDGRGELDARLVRVDTGHLHGEVLLPVPGQWRLRVVLVPTGGGPEQLLISFEVGR